VTPADKSEFSKVLLAFCELKGKQLSLAAVDLYWRSMQRWSLRDFQMAAEQLLRTCEFMPTPKDFEDLRKAGRPTAGEAWSLARKHADSCLSHGHVTGGGTCGDPFIDRVVHMIGGYGVLFMCESDKLGFLERRFAEHFATAQEATDTRDAVPQLTRQRPRVTDGPRRINAISLDLEPIE
jgi:hypothetical protein